MSKGSMFWNLATGKVGSLVLSINKGQVITRQHQPHVNNPRTAAQMLQRARFAGAVKFYKRATSNLFKFAYEDKKATESDYNAFMRHNTTSNLAALLHSQVKGNYPALARKWVLSDGSLQSPEYVGIVGGIPALSIPAYAEDTDTVGAVSTALITSYGLIEGDIVTIVKASSTVTSIKVSAVAEPTKWTVAQFIVSKTDATPITEVADGLNAAAGVGLYLDAQQQSTATFYGVVFSRKSSGGLLVSTSEMLPNAVALDLYQQSNKSDFQALVLNSWKAAAESVLEGSLVEASTAAVITEVGGVAIPKLSDTEMGVGAVSSATLTGTGLTNISAADFSGIGILISNYAAESDTAATITIKGTGSNPHTWVLKYKTTIIAQARDAQPTISKVTPSSVNVIGAGDEQVLTLSGSNLDTLALSKFATSDDQLTVKSGKYNTDGTYTLTLAAAAEVSSATVTYDGKQIFAVAEVVVVINESNIKVSDAGQQTISLTGEGLDKLAASSFTTAGSVSVVSYNATSSVAATLVVNFTNVSSDDKVMYNNVTIAAGSDVSYD